MKELIIGFALAGSALLGLAWVFFPQLFARTPKVPEVIEPIPHGNQFLVPEEIKRDPDLSKLQKFPARPAVSATPFEDFNQRLFILRDSPVYSWPERVIANDFPTELTGDYPWVLNELKRRLRPGFPTILDTFGWWAEASKALELDPRATNPVIEAYLALPLAKRPVVISRPYQQKSANEGKLEFFRYQFADYTFDRKFLAGHARAALQEAMAALTGPPAEWWAFSAARLRKKVLDEAAERRQLAATTESFAEEIRRATHKNRFAALWALPEHSAEQTK